MSESGVNDLLDAVTRLPPRALSEFEERLAHWKLESTSDAALIRATKKRLPAADAARLRALIEQSEAGQLSATDVQRYRELARQGEVLSAQRVQALGELVRRWGQPVEAVMQRVGWDAAQHGAYADFTRAAAANPGARRRAVRVLPVS